MLKNYIYYLGGSYGDLTETIINNGLSPSVLTKSMLKGKYNTSDNPAAIKNMILNLQLTTVSGHIKEPLYWNLNNFVIVIDGSLVETAVKRFYFLEGEKTFDNTLLHFYHKTLSSHISSLPLKFKFEMLQKKYNSFLKDNLPTNLTTINLNLIYHKESYLKILQLYFDFNIETANILYDIWYEKEKLVLEKIKRVV
jgi:hypothetical protein